jgi:PEP-CTERM motif
MMRVNKAVPHFLIGVGLLMSAQAEANFHPHRRTGIDAGLGHIAAPSSASQAPATASAGSLTLQGTDVDFVLSGGQLGNYGDPAVSGDTLYFTPTQFTADSSNGSGYDLASDTINITLVAHAGTHFDALGLLEKGDYLLLGSGSTAAVTGEIRAFDVSSPLVDETASISPQSSLSVTGLPSENWQAGANLDLATFESVESLDLTLENLLPVATTANPSLAFIEGKFVALTATMIPITAGSIVNSPVPEPDTYVTMLAGVGLVLLVACRRSSKKGSRGKSI